MSVHLFFFFCLGGGGGGSRRWGGGVALRVRSPALTACVSLQILEILKSWILEDLLYRFLKSWFLVNNSIFQYFKTSIFQYFKIQDFKISRLRGASEDPDPGVLHCAPKRGAPWRDRPVRHFWPRAPPQGPTSIDVCGYMCSYIYIYILAWTRRYTATGWNRYETSSIEFC